MPVNGFERRARLIFGLALRLYPASYREEYGREMTMVAVDRIRAARYAAMQSVVFLTDLASVLVDAPRQHAVVLMQDLRLAFRLMGREKSFATVAVGTVALGIALSTAVFSVGKALLVDALPYREADRAAMVWVSNPRQGYDRDYTSFPRVLAWRERSTLIESFAAYSYLRTVATGGGDPEQLRVIRATPEFFEVIRAEPVAGRVIAASEHEASVVVLSHGLWQRRFAGQRSAIGQTLLLDATPHAIVGVLPQSFHFPDRNVDAWVPLRMTQEDRDREAFWLESVGRLKAGVTLAQAQEEMNSIAMQLAAERPADKELGVVLVGLRDEIAGPFKSALVMLTAAVLGVLAIACVNVTGMLTARGASRRREVAIRTALGASRRRVVRQLLTESILLFVLGGALGVAFASLLLKAVVRVAPQELAWLRDVSLDLPMLVAALGISAVTGMLSGVLPSWKGAGAGLAGFAASGARGSSRGGLSQRFRWALVVSQIAIATMVVSAASLSLTSLVHARRVDLGFEAGHVMTARLELPQAKYPDPAARQQFYDRLLERTRGLPSVTEAAATSAVVGTSYSSRFSIEGRTEIIQQPLTSDVITPDFFRVLQVPLLRGRFFSDRDKADGERVAIINETTAKTYWPNEDPIGKRFRFGGPDGGGRLRTIVGVVADTRRAGVDRPVATESYQPHTQNPASMSIVVRTTGEPATIVPALRDVVRELDKDQPLGRISSLDALVDTQTASRRFSTWLLGAFGAAAMALTAIGLYSVLAYVVALRRHEMAVRLAIGGTRSHVVGLIVRHVSWLVVVGMTLGLAAALIVARSMQGLLFEVRPWDPMAQGTTIVLLCVVAVAAGWIPTIRAMRVDPATLLRTD